MLVHGTLFNYPVVIPVPNLQGQKFWGVVLLFSYIDFKGLPINTKYHTSSLSYILNSRNIAFNLFY